MPSVDTHVSDRRIPNRAAMRGLTGHVHSVGRSISVDANTGKQGEPWRGVKRDVHISAGHLLGMERSGVLSGP